MYRSLRKLTVNAFGSSARFFGSDSPFFPPLISKSNDKVRKIKSSATKHKRAKKEGTVYLEGYRLIVDALRYGFSPQIILVTQKEIDGLNGQQLLIELLPHRTKVYRVDENTMDSITTTVNSQG
jgi:tRNA G18 (ribose-2'-O)-methylase SpoU